MDGTLSRWSDALDARRGLAFGDSCLRGVGQIILMNNPITGALIIAALYLADPWLGTMSLVGLVTATATAHAMGVARGPVRAGLFGFNGTLVGGALATFLASDWSWVVTAYTVLGAVVTVPVAVAIGTILGEHLALPGLTVPFNLVTMTLLGMAPRVQNGQAGPLLAPTPENAPVSTSLRSAASSVEASWPEGILNGTLRGIGQLFFADSLWAGVLILVAIAVCSRIAAAVALGGSLIGVATGLVIGADGVGIYHGMYGYNGFVTAVAIAGVFFVPTARSIGYGLAAAVWSTIAFVAIAHLLAPVGIPAMTLPFCLVTLGALLLRGLPGLRPVELSQVTTPEDHRHLK